MARRRLVWKDPGMDALRIGIVWNPSKTSKEELESGLTDAAASAGAEPRVTWWETTPDDAGQGAAASALADGADVIVAAGGDGTVRAVAEHLAHEEADAELGIVPLGTGNLLARNLGVPLDDLPAAFGRVLAGTARPVDVGWAEVDLDGGTERHAFAVLAGFGIDAHMIAETDDDLKDKAGWLAYVESLGRAFTASEVIDLRLAVDDGEPADARAHTVLVGNCGTLQAGVTLLPDADPSDGELDLLVLSADGAVQWLDTIRNLVWDNGIRRLLTGTNGTESSDSAAHGRVRRLRVELGEPRVFEIDGEDLGETQRVTITVQPGAVRIR